MSEQNSPSVRDRIGKLIMSNSQDAADDDDEDAADDDDEDAADDGFDIDDAEEIIAKERNAGDDHGRRSDVSSDPEEAFRLLGRLYAQLDGYHDRLADFGDELQLKRENVSRQLDEVQQELANTSGQSRNLQRKEERLEEKLEKTDNRLKMIDDRRFDVDEARDDLEFLEIDIKGRIIGGGDLQEDIADLRSLVHGDSEDMPITKEVEHACDQIDQMIPDDGTGYAQTGAFLYETEDLIETDDDIQGQSQ